MNDKTLTTEHTEITKARKELNELTKIVIGCAIEVPIHDAQLLSYLKVERHESRAPDQLQRAHAHAWHSSQGPWRPKRSFIVAL
jgi:hypothetical protein